MRYSSCHAPLAATITLLALLSQAPEAEANRGKNSSTGSTGTPFLAFDADRLDLQSGDTVLLSWATANVGRCMASGGWSGRQKESGSYRSEALLADTAFKLSCLTETGTVEKTVAISVTPASASPGSTTTETTGTTSGSTTETTSELTGTTGGTTTETTSEPTGTTSEPTGTTSGTTAESTSGTTPEPTVAATPRLQLQTSSPVVKTGESVTVSWTGEAVSDCQASGAWSGTRPTSGSEVRESLTASENYTLSCQSASGQIMAMTSVQVTIGGTQISWQPPQQNVDGSPLTDLSAYRIYVGAISQSYDQQIELTDTSATQHFVDLVPGEYYIAMTAIDVEGNESALSNEVHKIIQ
jgi:hypothetical protein